VKYNLTLIRNTIQKKLLIMLTALWFVFPIGSCAFAGGIVAGSDHNGKNPASIRIGIIGDQTGTADLNAAYGYLQQGVTALSAKNLDVVIHVGDLLESSKSEAEVSAQYNTATGILDALPVDWFMTAGDHDVNPPVFQQDSGDRSREALFKSLYGTRVPEVLDQPYYSFDVNGYHFVSLYSLEALHADPRWGNIFLNQVTEEQFQWLKNDLTTHKDSRGIVVFLHHPMWYNWNAWQRVHKLLSRHRVSTVVAGHFHYDQRDMRVDGIRYVVVGATGGTVKQGARDAGNVQHVSVMTVRGAKVIDFELISLSDNNPLKLTPRVDMDKVQAMDIVLGELWNFASTNPVLLKNGVLVNSCGSTSPAKVHITPIGNPTDKLIDIDIAFSSENGSVGISSAGFTPGQCETVINDYQCKMARSSRIFFSNLSSVSVNSFAGPLWEAVLDSGSTPTVGTVLNFDIKLTYPGKSGDLYLERQVSTTVGSCQ